LRGGAAGGAVTATAPAGTPFSRRIV
jgi:hypothetical protein